MKPALPMLRYPESAVAEPRPLNLGLLQAALLWGAVASCLFVATQLGLSAALSDGESSRCGLFFIPRFFAQVLGRGFWDPPWIFLQALMLGSQLWSLLLLKRLTLNSPQLSVASRALTSWLALLVFLLCSGLMQLANHGGFAILATLLAGVCGYAALICQAVLYRGLAQRIKNPRVAVLAKCLLAGLIMAPVLGVFSFGSGFFSVVSDLLSGGGKVPGKRDLALLHQAETMHLILAAAVIATILLHVLMTLVFYLEIQAKRPPALPMAIEVLPNPLED